VAPRVNSLRLANALKERFFTQGWTQSQVAESLDVAQGQISKILAGKFRFGKGLVARVCKYAQINLYDFQMQFTGSAGETVALVQRFCRGDKRREKMLIRLLLLLDEL
jgi:transcriptional regulator with XRE-family HTH domain